MAVVRGRVKVQGVGLAIDGGIVENVEVVVGLVLETEVFVHLAEPPQQRFRLTVDAHIVGCREAVAISGIIPYCGFGDTYAVEVVAPAVVGEGDGKAVEVAHALIVIVIEPYVGHPHAVDDDRRWNDGFGVCVLQTVGSHFEHDTVARLLWCIDHVLAVGSVAGGIFVPVHPIADAGIGDCLDIAS